MLCARVRDCVLVWGQRDRDVGLAENGEAKGGGTEDVEGYPNEITKERRPNPRRHR